MDMSILIPNSNIARFYHEESEYTLPKETNIEVGT